jgi:ABC-type multidrug transport system ATPase subunit
MIYAVIGPNGFGKTTYLQKKEADLIAAGISENDILFLESEILLSDEVKDTKDDTKTMEYIIQNLLNTPAITAAKNVYEVEVDKAVNANIPNMNNIMDRILSYNGNTRTTDFISPTKNKEYKKLVKINNTDYLKSMGSGQRMQFLLDLASKSTKKVVFLDEPEKYSHPSFLNITAKLIMSFNTLGRDVYIATHSPKLLSMLDIQLNNISVINDSTHTPKAIDLNKAVTDISSQLTISNFQNYEKEYYDVSKIEHHIRLNNYRSFLEALFARKIYICEGLNDRSFLNKYLQDNGLFYDDYVILPTFGKRLMPLFVQVFKNLGGYDISIIYDKDDNRKDSSNDRLNTAITGFGFKSYGFSPNIEKELLYTKNKMDCIGFIDHISGMSFPISKYNI